MFDGTRLLGNVFLANNERLQDIMNDERGFIPVHVDDQSTRSLVMLSKRYIQQVEEVAPGSPEVGDLYRPYGRGRADQDRSETSGQSSASSSGLKLEIDDNPFSVQKDKDK
ncbi:MAG: hypothetical protein CMI01_16250 [Oceanospirillaceae bacterium]|jgi:hypothetical protein|nr:hypothetical protein [Oceanospirillaceae bacterium]